MRPQVDILLKVEENGQYIDLPRPINSDLNCFLMGYSFYDTVPNIQNFSLEVGGITIAIEDGNYSYDEFVFTLNTALSGAGLSDVDTDAKNASIQFNEATEALNVDTARLLNMTVNEVNNTGFSTGILSLGGNRIFYVNIDGINTHMMADGRSGFFKILNPDGGAFTHIAASNYSNPQLGENNMTLSQTKVTIYDEYFRLIKIYKGSPAYFNIFCYSRN